SAAIPIGSSFFISSLSGAKDLFDFEPRGGVEVDLMSLRGISSAVRFSTSRWRRSRRRKALRDRQLPGRLGADDARRVAKHRQGQPRKSGARLSKEKEIVGQRIAYEEPNVEITGTGYELAYYDEAGERHDLEK